MSEDRGHSKLKMPRSIGQFLQLCSRNHTVRIQHELLCRSFVEVFVTLDGLFQFYNGNVDRLGNFDLVMRIAIINCRLYFSTGH